MSKVQSGGSRGEAAEYAALQTLRDVMRRKRREASGVRGIPALSIGPEVHNDRPGAKRGLQVTHLSRFTFHVSRVAAFTLIELMVVIGLLAILASISVPSIRGMLHNESMRKAAQDAQEVCQNARARAILHGSMTEVVIHADPPTMEVAGSGPERDGSGLVAHFALGGDVGVESIKVNGVQYKDAVMARVRFFPNGTCDEFRMVLLRPRDNLRRGIFCEVTTSLADIEMDQTMLANEAR